MTRSTTSVAELTDFDPYNDEFRRDPYPHYRRIRELGPVYWEYLDSYVVSTHADALKVLTDPSTRVEPPPEIGELLAALMPETLRTMQNTVLFRDPPGQTRLRNLTRKAFAPSALAGVLDDARLTVRRLFAEAAERGSADLVEDLAFPVALQVIGDLLGLPRADLPMLRDLGQAVSPAADMPATPGSVENAVEGIAAFTEYFRKLCEARESGSGEDLYSQLVRARRAGELSTDELISNAILIFISGHETLVAFMASAVLTLLGHPGQLALLRADPSLAPSAVDEILRYESPLQLATAGGGRWTTKDLTLGGVVIPAEQRVLTLIAAANRDPAEYPDPDRFDITRPAGKHLALGHGLHYCLGAAMAKQQGAMMLEEFARWDVDLTLAHTEPSWLPLFMQRRLAALPLRITTR